MAPKRKPPRQKTQTELTVARLRGVCAGTLLAADPPSFQPEPEASPPASPASCESPRPPPPPREVPPPLPGVPRALARSDGADIVKRAVGRRSRFLFLLPGGLSITAGARIGQLSCLDTPTPVLYIEFGPAAWGGNEVGRLKCWGVHFYPRNAVLTLRGGGKAVMCEDVMETVVVFGEWAWVGGAIANPSEEVLPLPLGLAEVVGPGGGADIWPKGGGEGARGRGARPKRPAGGEAVCLDEEEEAEAEGAAAYEGGLHGGVEGVDTPALQASTRKRARHADGTGDYGDYVGIGEEEGDRVAEDEDSDFVVG
ncbi:hypothetical protein MMPV_004752 [Pyropia vietnamensis]